jgi:hypothetical protein
MSADPLACARLVDGVPIRIGSPVYDSAGEAVGSVSLSQCSLEPGADKLRVRLQSSLGGEIKTFDLAGVRTDGFAVSLPLTNAQIAQVPPESEAYAANPLPGA